MKTFHFLPAGALAAALVLVAGVASAQEVASTTSKSAVRSADSAIVVSLIAANQKEVAAAEQAVAQAQSDRVKNFARTIQSDHSKIVEELQGWLEKTGGMSSGMANDSVKVPDSMVTPRPVPDSVVPQKPVPDSVVPQKPVPDSVVTQNPPKNPPDTTYANQETRNQPVTQPAEQPSPTAGKTGKEFDQAFLAAMVSEHETAIRDLRENIIPRIQDSDLKHKVQGFLPTLGNHLRDAQALQAAIK
jgi:predicted outer membrane protein